MKVRISLLRLKKKTPFDKLRLRSAAQEEFPQCFRGAGCDLLSHLVVKSGNYGTSHMANLIIVVHCINVLFKHTRNVLDLRKTRRSIYLNS